MKIISPKSNSMKKFILSAIIICSAVITSFSQNIGAGIGNFKSLNVSGSTTPATFDSVKVNGNVNITGKLTTGGVTIEKTLLGTSIKVDKINIGSDSLGMREICSHDSDIFLQSHAGLRNTLFNVHNTGKVGIGTSTPSERLDVNGNARVSGNLIVNGNLSFAGNKTISFTPASAGIPEIISYGYIDPPPTGPCFTPQITTVNQFRGMVQAWGTNSDNILNILSMGFDGANGIIDIAGSSNNIAPRLLINYYCGKDVLICTGSQGGSVSMCTPTTGNVGIGATSGNTRLNLQGLGHTSSTSALKINNNNGNILMIVQDDGKVGIGTTQIGNSKLAVEGRIAARELKLTVNPFPDYVFEKGYKLLSLEELQNFILTNKHLPEIPSADEVKSNDGIDVGKMQADLLKKIEELTLYIIQQDQKIKELQTEVKDFKK